MKNISIALCGILMFGFSVKTFSAERGYCKEFKPITFGILPFISADQLVERFSPLAQYLSKKLEVPVHIETAPNFIEFSRRTLEEPRYDILFTAPHFYSQANSIAGYRLIASVDSPGMWAVIVVPRKSNIYRVRDLLGKRLATVDPMGLATLLVRKHLSEHGINPDKDLSIIATPTHNASLLSSYHRVTDASALMYPPYAAAGEHIRESMRIILRTESTPHIPISTSVRISSRCAAQISELLLKMDATDEGSKILNHNKFSGFKRPQAREYESVSDLLAY